MMATLTQSIPVTVEKNELLLISQPALREKLLQARLTDDFSARSVIQRGNEVYLSLHEIQNPEERQAVNWAVVKLQLGANIPTEELPVSLRTALTAVSTGPSPLIEALIWGSLFGVIGGVLVMALVGLVVTIANVPAESYVGVMATAVAFVLSGTITGLGSTVFFWRKLMKRPKAVQINPTLPKIVRTPK